jgi:hypothetical protein
MYTICIRNTARSKSIPLLCTHVGSYKFSTVHPLSTYLSSRPICRYEATLTYLLAPYYNIKPILLLYPPSQRLVVAVTLVGMIIGFSKEVKQTCRMWTTRDFNHDHFKARVANQPSNLLNLRQMMVNLYMDNSPEEPSDIERVLIFS